MSQIRDALDESGDMFHSGLSITTHSIIVGIDIHKYTHTAVAMDCFGKQLSHCTFDSDDAETCLEWLTSVGQKDQLRIGLEDISGNGRGLATVLLSQGYHCRYVPAVLTSGERARSIQKDKTDLLDALRVGKVMLTRGEQTLPADTIVSRTEHVRRELDFLLKEREHLVREQTGLKNNLHAMLHEHYGNGYQQSFTDIFSAKALEWYKKDLGGLLGGGTSQSESVVSSSIRRCMTRLILIQSQITEITKTLSKVSKRIPQISHLSDQIVGCGALTATAIMVEIGEVRRFSSGNKLAKYAGIAPIEVSSGKTVRHRTNPSGNRKLNRAIHRIALSQIGRRGDDTGKTYYQKKQLEGKTKLWSLRCLKRQIIRRVFHLLTEYERLPMRKEGALPIPTS